MLIMRRSYSVGGYLCKNCIEEYFWNYTGRTIVFGWWGIISFIVTPFILLNNLFYYFLSLRLKKPAAQYSGESNTFWKLVTIGAALAIIAFIFYILGVSSIPGGNSTSGSSTVETCALHLVGSKTFVVMEGADANDACEHALTDNPGDYTRSHGPPKSPIICQRTVGGIIIKVIDSDPTHIIGDIACDALYE